MGRPPKIRTPKQIEKGQERSAVAREIIRASGIQMATICHLVGRSYCTVSGWLRYGLSESQYRIILQAVANARADREGR